jgi:hypothetical protein
VDEARLAALQAAGMMPAASYTLDLAGACDSFFGPHEARERVEYHAKGYVSWLGSLACCETPEQAYALFARRYRARVAGLLADGHAPADDKLHAGLDAHIGQEWASFSNGIYGLCTRSGLPEDIAAKELAVMVINELTANTTRADLDDEARRRLARAVDLLDAASAPFAPHERARSSRHRLVDGLRAAYRL